MELASRSRAFSVVGGARVGLVSATWPLVRLAASPDALALSGALGRFEFAPRDVVAIEKFGSIPFFSAGLRIRHTRTDYPASVVFWCMGSRSQVMGNIAGAGFVPRAQASDENTGRGFPLRWSVVVAVIVAWNSLIFADVASGHRWPSLYASLAFAIVFAVACGLVFLPRVQALLLRPGHVIGEIRPFVLLLVLISGLGLVVFAWAKFVQ